MWTGRLGTGIKMAGAVVSPDFMIETDLESVKASSPATDRRAVQRACRAVRAAFDARGMARPVIAQTDVGARMAPAGGLSIYFSAFRNPSVHYRELDFTRPRGVGRLPRRVPGGGAIGRRDARDAGGRAASPTFGAPGLGCSRWRATIEGNSLVQCGHHEPQK